MSTSAAAAVSEEAEPPAGSSTPALVKLVLIPVGAATGSAAFGAILAFLLDVRPGLAAAAGATYFCFVLASASLVLHVLAHRTTELP